MTEKLIRGIVDLDNVVSDWLGWYITQIGMMPSIHGLNTGKLTDMYPDTSVEELEKIVADRRGYLDTDPIDNSARSLRELLKEFPNIHIFYLSAAVREAEDARRMWMEMYDFPLDHPQVEGLLHVGTPDQPGHGHEKIEWINAHGEDYDFIIDDQLKYLDAAWAAGIEHCYAFFQLWNANDGNHTTVFSWEDFVHQLKEDFSL